MKQLLLTLFLGVSSICYSQDTLQIPAVELEEFFLALDTLEVQDSLKASLILDKDKINANQHSTGFCDGQWCSC